MTIEEVLETVAIELRFMLEKERQYFRLKVTNHGNGSLSMHSDRVTGNVDETGNLLVWK
jgi:hypothetical protein